MRVALAIIAMAAAGCASAKTGGSSGPDGSSSHPDAAGHSPDANVTAPDARPIDANTCPTQPCSLAPQCGCTGGMACDISSTNVNMTACRGVSTPGATGNTCASANDCAAGYVCVGDGTNDSCEKYCTSNADCGSPRGQCVIQLTSGNPPTPIPNAVTCSSNCDPTSLSNPLCPPSWTCDLFQSAYNQQTYDIVDCRKAGTVGAGGTCSASMPCATGYTCATVGTSSTCHRITNFNSPSCSGVLEFNPPFTVGGTEYGVCP